MMLFRLLIHSNELFRALFFHMFMLSQMLMMFHTAHDNVVSHVNTFEWVVSHVIFPHVNLFYILVFHMSMLFHISQFNVVLHCNIVPDIEFGFTDHMLMSFHILMFHSRRRSDLKILGSPDYPVFLDLLRVRVTPFTRLKPLLTFWGLPRKCVWYVWGLLWKLVGNFGSHNYLKSDLLRLWFTY